MCFYWSSKIFICKPSTLAQAEKLAKPFLETDTPTTLHTKAGIEALNAELLKLIDAFIVYFILPCKV